MYQNFLFDVHEVDRNKSSERSYETSFRKDF